MKIERLSPKELVTAPFDGKNLINEWEEFFGDIMDIYTLSEIGNVVTFNTIYGGIITFSYKRNELHFVLCRHCTTTKDYEHLIDLIDAIGDCDGVIVDRETISNDYATYINVKTYFEL